MEVIKEEGNGSDKELTAPRACLWKSTYCVPHVLPRVIHKILITRVCTDQVFAVDLKKCEEGPVPEISF